MGVAVGISQLVGYCIQEQVAPYIRWREDIETHGYRGPDQLYTHIQCTVHMLCKWNNWRANRGHLVNTVVPMYT